MKDILLRSKDGDSSGSIDRLGSGSIANQVYDQLMEQILTLQLRPFDELSEARLAAELGVSRTPVREAFARLARRGLVEIIPQRATRIAPLSEELIAYSRFVREALERPLVRKAAETFTPEKDRQLTRELATQSACARRGDAQEFLLSDNRFHALIAWAAGYETVWNDVRKAKFHMDRIRRLSPMSKEQMQRIVDQHQALLDHLRARDAETADSSLMEHLHADMEELDRIRAQQPEYFSCETAARPRG